jgi:hypothetical protein
LRQERGENAGHGTANQGAFGETLQMEGPKAPKSSPKIKLAEEKRPRSTSTITAIGEAHMLMTKRKPASVGEISPLS